MMSDQESETPPPSWANLVRDRLKEFYFAVGVGMTQWQYVEFELTQLFSILVKTEDGTASAVFNSVPSFPTKLKMVQAAAAVRLAEPKLFKQCIVLCKRLEDTSGKRNELAHFMLFKDLPDVGVEDPKKLVREIDLYLAPTAFDGARYWRYKGKRYKGKPPQLKLADIQSHAKAFSDASNDIREFTKQVQDYFAQK
jgi:hypothetical protein